MQLALQLHHIDIEFRQLKRCLIFNLNMRKKICIQLQLAFAPPSLYEQYFFLLRLWAGNRWGSAACN